MLNLINRVVILTIHLIPKFFIKIFANQYVAGITTKDALKTVKRLNVQGFAVTLDILGEHTNSKGKAELITKQYCDILAQININNLDCNISIKPSHIGSDISNKLLMKNIRILHEISMKNNNFIRIDMENSELTDLTLNTYKNRYISENNIGVVLQAYLYRTEQDLLQLKDGSNIRLCKGIYNENQSIAIKIPDEINSNYIRLLKIAFKKHIYVGIATHDIHLIKRVLDIIDKLNIDKSMFEFQMLYGVPMGNSLDNIITKKYRVRIYVPFGEDWYEYSIRRIKENPNISKYVIKNMFRIK
jgi:proline dehydrogenase